MKRRFKLHLYELKHSFAEYFFFVKIKLESTLFKHYTDYKGLSKRPVKKIVTRKGVYMSEKIQRTAASMREKMLHRYNDGLDHKHNKNHHSYRHHCRSHPANHKESIEEESSINSSTGLLRAFKLRKTRKRLDKGRIH